MPRDFKRRLGDRIQLRGPRGGSCTVTAPSGLEYRHPPASNGRADVVLDQVGEWWYEWSNDGPNGSIHVGRAAEVVADSAPVAEPTGPAIDIGRLRSELMIDRVLQGSTPTISVTITAGTTPVNPSPDTATVTIRRADGTVAVLDGTAADGGIGVFNFVLTTAETALLDILQAEWTVVIGGMSQTRTTYHEVVGGYLISLTELGALYPNDSDSELANKRTALESRLEGALRYACVPRYARENRVPRRNTIYLTWSPVRLLREVIVDGTPWEPDSVSNAHFNPQTGIVYYVPRMRLGGATTIAYEHGEDYPEIDVARAMSLLAQETYGTDLGAFDSRVVRREADGQAITYASPSLSGGSFVTPELNAIVRGSRKILIR